MKLIIAIFAVTIFVVAGAGVYFYIRQSPIEEIANEVLAGDRPVQANVELTPELRAFVDWYEPIVSDAPEQVIAIMKRFDAKYRADGYRDRDLEQIIPTDEWLKRLLDMGVKIESYDDYSDYMEDRWYVYHAATDPEELQDLKDRHDLDADASFDEVVEASIREDVQFKQLLDQAMANDPKVYGGSFSEEGVFIPFRLKTVYVQPGTIRKGRGVPKWVVHEIRERELGNPPSREIPDDIDIIYLDEKGQSIKDRVLPSGGEGHEIEVLSSSEIDTGGDLANPDSSGLADDIDNSFPDDVPPSDTTSYEFEKPNLPQSIADIEKQFSLEGIEAELSEGLSPERFNNAQQLIDQYGWEEGLRRLRESDPEAARQFESDKSRPLSRDVLGEGQSESGSKD